MSCSCCRQPGEDKESREETDRGAVLARCREAGMRRTPALEHLVRAMYAAGLPRTWQELGAAPELAGYCDKATVFRLLKRLEENGIVRKIGTHERSARYMIQSAGCHHDFLVCRECGQLEVLDLACPAEKLEREIEGRTGYAGLTHDLTFYGVCRECQEAARQGEA